MHDNIDPPWLLFWPLLSTIVSSHVTKDYFQNYFPNEINSLKSKNEKTIYENRFWGKKSFIANAEITHGNLGPTSRF